MQTEEEKVKHFCFCVDAPASCQTSPVLAVLNICSMTEIDNENLGFIGIFDIFELTISVGFVFSQGASASQVTICRREFSSLRESTA